MRKLTLDLDSLAVDSFATDASPPARGTVAAHAITQVNCPVTGTDCQTNLVYCTTRDVLQCG